MTRIPLDPIGYSVNPSTGTIHTRYAGDHAGEAYRTRTEKGVLALLDGKPGTACETCYGKTPRYASDPTALVKPQRRRKPKARKVGR